MSQIYYASRKSSYFTLVATLWGGVVIAFVQSYLKYHVFLTVGSGCAVATIVFMHWYMAKTCRPSRQLVTLDTNGISSPLFSDRKQYFWAQIANVTMRRQGGAVLFEFELDPKQELTITNYYSATDPKRPTMNVIALSSYDQQQLFRAIHRYLALTPKAQNTSYSTAADAQTPVSPDELDQIVEQLTTEHQVVDQHFYASRNSAYTRLIVLIWLGFTVFAVRLYLNNLDYPGIAIAIGLFFLAFFPRLIHWYLRRKMRPSAELVSLDRHGISSPLFPEQKRYRWSQIINATLQRRFLGSRLVLVLDPDQELTVRNYYSGMNLYQPTLNVGAMSHQDQQQLLSAIISRIATYRKWHKPVEDEILDSDIPVTPLTLDESLLPNPFAEEQAFIERFKALAPIPWVTYGLIAINTMIWLLMLTQGAEMGQTPSSMLLAWGGNLTDLVKEGQWWRLLSATFLHGSLLHLALNMLGLYSIGSSAERLYGHKLFSLTYLCCGLLASCASLYFGAQTAVSVGASGAIFGIAGAQLLGFYLQRRFLPTTYKQQYRSSGWFLIYALMQGMGKAQIDNAAHVGGLAAGLLLALLLPQRLNLKQFNKIQVMASRWALVLTLVVAVVAVSKAPSSPIGAIAAARLSMHSLFLKIVQDQKDMEAGKFTELELSQHARTVYLPQFEQIRANLQTLTIRQDQPLFQKWQDTKKLSELMIESLAMEDVINPATGKLEPSDPARFSAIEQEIKQLAEHF